MPLRRPARHLSRARLGIFAIAAPACLVLAACGHSGGSKPPNLTSVASQSTGAETAEPSSSTDPSETVGSSDDSAPRTSSGARRGATRGTTRGAEGSTPGAHSANPGSTASDGATPSSTGTDGANPGDTSTSGAGTIYNAAGWSQFTTPTGKNWCDLIPNQYVGCHLSPALQAQHKGNPYIMLDTNGVKFMTGDPGMNLDGIASAWASGAGLKTLNGTTVLPYGSALKGGSITCSSSPYGFTCSNGKASFTVSSTKVTTSGKVA